MTLYYVRKTGNDGAAGTSPATAWLTIGKALGAAGIASGDTVYIGAGVYRETVTVAMTSAVAETSVIGDVDGSKTGDAGYVVWTSYTTNDKTASAAGDTLNLAGRDYLTLRNLIIVHGGVGQGIDGSTAHPTNITVRNCVLIAGGDTSSAASVLHTASFGIPSTWVIDSCSFFGNNVSVQLTVPTGSGADYDTDIQIRSCRFVGGGASSIAVWVASSGTSAQEGGGVDITNCTVFGKQAVLTTGTRLSLTIPNTVRNSSIYTGGVVALSSSESGNLTEDYNLIVAATPRTNVSAGANSITTAYAPMFHVGQAEMMGFGCRPFGSPMTYDAPVMAFGDDGTALTTDLLGNLKPGGGRSATRAVGCFEFANGFVQSTANPRTGTNHLRCTGPGQHDFDIPVESGAATVSIWVEWDATYAGTKPEMSIVNGEQAGVTAATATATGASGSYEQLALAFTATSDGIITIRLRSSDTNGAGLSDWDDLEVT